MKIVIRAEGGYRTGMGHVMRMLVLADKLRAFAEVVFLCKDNAEFLAGVSCVQSHGYTVLRIDSTRFSGELEKIKGDCLITDSYDVDENYFDSTKAIFDITGYMDDLNKCRINADFIINQNIYADDLEYKANKNTRFFMGTEYALLREEFRDMPKRNMRNKMEDVLVTMGGADPENLSEIITLKLSKAFPDIRFHIAAGPSFIHMDDLKKIERENIFLHYNRKMSELMLRCDAAVSACGSTVYELCACGTPIIGIAAADNQIMAAHRMNSIGALKHAEGPEEIIKHLKSLNFETRVRMSETGQGLVDGYGSSRLSEQIREIISNKV